MDRTERFYKMIRLLESRRSVSRSAFLEELEVSPATVERDFKMAKAWLGRELAGGKP